MKLNELKKIIKEVINEGVHYDDAEYKKQETVIINLLNLVKNEDTDDTDWDRAYEMLENIVNQLKRDVKVLINILSNEDSDDVDFDNAYNDLGYINKLFSVLIDNKYDAADELEGLMGNIHLALTGGSGVEKMAISENKQKTMKKQEFINLIKECINEVMLEGRIQDPDKEEMVQYLRSQYGSEFNDDDAEVAMYYFASDFHGGQASNLYSVLSTSEYKPGASGNVESEGELVKMMYDTLVDEFGGGIDSSDDSGEMSLDKIADLRGNYDEPPEPMDSEDDFNERVNFSLNELKNLIGECISEVYSEQGMLKEKAPPGMEDFIKSSKKSFIDQYGEEEGMKNLYATAWKKFYEKQSKKEEGSCGCAETNKCECGTMEEAKWQQAALHPSKKGMFDGKTMADLKKMLVAVKNQTDSYKSKGEKVPDKLRSKIGQLLYAIRAKKHHGSLKKGSDI